MRRGVVCRVLAATATVLTTVLTGPALAAPPRTAPERPSPAPSAPRAVAGDVELSLRSVTPTIASPGQPLTIAGTLRNTSAAPIPRPVVRVVGGTNPLRRREDVSAWASATGPAQGSELARTRLSATVAPGGTVDFQVTVTGAAGRGEATYGALPLSIEVGQTSLRTFAGYQRIKQYQPLQVSWAIPLTLDADPDLFGAEGRDREAAWARALGLGSRLSRILDATEDLPVTWAIDPTLTPSLLPEGDTLEEGKGKVEQVARGNAESRIRAAATRHSVWVLPDTDGDIAAVSSAGDGTPLMEMLVARSVPVARALEGRDDIAWPVDGVHTAAREGTLRRLFTASGLTGQVAAQSVLPGGASAATTPEAARRSTGGLSVLAYDDRLSDLLTRTTSPAEGVLSAQRFIAESAALLDELPGTRSRTVFVTAPRTFNPDPQAADTFFRAVRAVPWLEQVTTEDQLAAAERAVPMPNSLATRPSSEPTTGGPAVLTGTRAAALERSVATVRGVALIRDDGDAFARTWSRAAEQLASVRWRADPVAWHTLNGRIQAAARETTTAVKVSARTINFLAETGRLQITVTNDLDVAVQNVKLTLDPANPRLRVDSPPALLRIGANSRATVNVEVTAFAAGPVPIRTTLTTPDGTVVGQGADVRVQVTPTGNWVYWVLGAVAGVILLLGIWRSLRGRPNRRTGLPMDRAA